MIKSLEGTQYRRNTTHVKLYHERDKPNGPEKSTSQGDEVRDVAVDQGEMERNQKQREFQAEGHHVYVVSKTSADKTYSKEISGRFWNEHSSLNFDIYY